MSAWTPAREETLTTLWQRRPRSVRRIAEELGTSTGAIYRQARKIGLDVPKRTTAPRPLAKSHPAIRQSRPRHTKQLVTAETSPALFVQGRMSRKIGVRVTKGRWAGMPLDTLTLAERITCPRSCLNWTSCYGNNLNWPRRHILDLDLIERMRWELTSLNVRHPAGFVVRIHVLGDFGSDGDPGLALLYVQAWERWMRQFPALRVFGFTAWAPDSIVGEVVDRLNAGFRRSLARQVLRPCARRTRRPDCRAGRGQRARSLPVGRRQGRQLRRVRSVLDDGPHGRVREALMRHPPQLTHCDRAERQRRIAKRYHESRLPAHIVAREFGVSRGHVSYIARIYGVNRRAGRPSA